MNKKILRRLIIIALIIAAIAGLRVARNRSLPKGFDGVVELEQLRLGFELNGRLKEVLVQRGDTVKKGQVLARLDDTLDRSLLEVRQAEVEQAQAKYDLAIAGPRKTEIKSLEADLEAAEAQVDYAQREGERLKKLLDNGTISQGQWDDAVNHYNQAKAQRDSVKQKLKTLEQGSRSEEIRAVRGARDAAKAQLASLEERLNHYELRAPADGFILSVPAKSGEVVTNGSAAVILAEPDLPYVDIFLPSARVTAIKVGDPATVLPDGFMQPYQAVVESVSPTTEYTPRYLLSEEDRQALVTRVRVRIRNPDGRIHGGVPCKVELGTGAA